MTCGRPPAGHLARLIPVNSRTPTNCVMTGTSFGKPMLLQVEKLSGEREPDS